jgi:hypothetical protein
MKNLFLVLFLFCLFNSCRKDEEVMVSTIIIKVNENFLIGFEEAHYLFITDSLGDVLDTKQIETGQTITLTTSKPIKRINLTQLYIYKGTTRETYISNTTLNVPLGEQIELAQSSNLAMPLSIGAAKINIGGYRGPLDPTYSFNFSNGYDLPWNLGLKSISLENGTVNAEMTLREDKSEIFILGYKDSKPAYHILKGINVGDNISIGTSDFQSYSKSLSFDSPNQTNGLIIGYYKKNEGHFGYLLSSTDYSGNNSYFGKPFLGYIDGYDMYSASVTSYLNKSLVTYYKHGSTLPTSIDLTLGQLTFGSKDINEFEYSVSVPYTYRLSQWAYRETAPKERLFFWNVVGNLNFQKVNLPSELKAKYDFLRIENLKYERSSFVSFLDGKSYVGYIKDFFQGKNNSLENYTYTFTE